MSNHNAEIIGKPVKDMYGSQIGTTVGTLTDIDGSVHTVGIDCGHSGLMQVSYSQLVVQDDVIVFIPKWRLDSQKMLREKGMTLRRLRALIDIVSENDDMRDDASIVHATYRAKLDSFESTHREIDADLNARLSQLNEQLDAVKIIVFDARIQSKSGEMTDTAFSTVSEQTNSLKEHIKNEISEIKRIQQRLADLETEVEQTLCAQTKDAVLEEQTTLPKVPMHVTMPEPPDPTTRQQVQTPTAEMQAISKESDWLSRMRAQ
ncbi:MAG: hypothetical protein K8823_1437 [Cenarchaeum symbiont of Oopsacas minuta]|nr:hypothetical protein [Cenarchaeum symbiont of Oopsacas minuta]